LAKARTGFLGEKDLPKLAAANIWLSQAPIIMDDSSGMTPIGPKARCRRLARERNNRRPHNRRLPATDAYLWLDDSREKEITEICSLKALAKELEVPVIVLSQLNREVERRFGPSSASRRPA
jgi:replicative DNA helicase